MSETNTLYASLTSQDCLFHTSTTSHLPIKAMKNRQLMSSLLTENGKVKPIHLQLSLTNACNLDCPFCSFKKRDKTQQLSYENVTDIINTFIPLGMEALTLTGGGEPLCHPDINKILLFCKEKNVKTGLITNGILLDELSKKSLEALTWCRISFGDDKNNDDVEQISALLRKVYKKTPSNDNFWSFSYVVMETQKPEIQRKIVSLVKKLKMQNVRFVSDQSNTVRVDLALTIANNGYIYDHNKRSICIYDEKILEKAFPRCRLYLIKPFIAADGYIYPCCCIQYRSDNMNFTENERICYYKEFEEKLRSTQIYQHNCSKCYFNHYNEFIDAFQHNVIHGEWI